MSNFNFIEKLIFFDRPEYILQRYQNCPKKTLIILGQGFDPRMCEGLSAIDGHLENLDIQLLIYGDGNYSPSEKYQAMVTENINRLNLFNRKITEIAIDMANNANLSLVVKGCFNVDILKNQYERIVIDISAMPQSIFFNLIKHLYMEITRKNLDIKLDILVCENSELDDAIIPMELSETATSLSGFDMFLSDLDSDENPINIWIPLLGKGCLDELEKLFTYISPDEICPVLPFPSKNPRRSDEILSDLGEQLFGAFLVESKNIIYAAEHNVLDVFLKLQKSIVHYNQVLKTIGSPKFYISLGSSKLIGLGALIANFDLREQGVTTTFAVVENRGYTFDIEKYLQENNRICCLCLNENRYEW